MNDWSSVAALIYIGGILLGLGLVDAGPVGRVALALLWPLGPVAFTVTIAILLATSLVAFPLFGLSVLAVAGLTWWLTG